MRVASIEAAHLDMTRVGAAHRTEIKLGRTGLRYFFVRDPDGNYLELVQDDRHLPK